MSYTLRGRLETRLAALVVPVTAAVAISAAAAEWWPVELVLVMILLALALDIAAYHPLLRYQPGWAALPLGLLELGAMMALLVWLDVRAPLAVALAIFGAGWISAQVLGHALLPWWRWSYAEDGGELGRAGPLLAVLVAAPLVAAGSLWFSHLPPTVRLASGLHRGPLVIDRRERLVGEDGAVVDGGIIVRHSDVAISNVRVVGGENGIAIDEVDHVRLNDVSLSGFALDGIHVRRAAVTIRDCSIDMRGVRYGQGIDISYATDKGESRVEGCRIVGGQEGIVTHSAMAMVKNNHVERATLRGISITEMSMGAVERNTVRDTRGVGILCGDHSMCEIRHNVVVGTRRDTSGGDLTRAGFGIESQYYADAELSGNELSRNPSRLGVFANATVRWKR